MITIIDYNAGNLTSVKRALDGLGIGSAISPDPDVVRNAERIVFPGVGHAATAMNFLRERGLDSAIIEACGKGVPILGICLGCQIVLSRSEEGDTRCLDLIPGETKRFQLPDPALKIPHMGWNAVTVARPHPLLADIARGDEFYFVHSYYPQPADPACVFATCEYGVVFPAAVGAANLFAVQFHPEKSGRAGLSILLRFSTWDGAPC